MFLSQQLLCSLLNIASDLVMTLSEIHGHLTAKSLFVHVIFTRAAAAAVLVQFAAILIGVGITVDFFGIRGRSSEVLLTPLTVVTCLIATVAPCGLGSVVE